jgi:hypothetical protein
MWERVCTKLRFRLAFEHAETMEFIQNYLGRNTLPSTGGDCEVLFRTLEEVAAENEQHDVEGVVPELLMYDSWSGHPHTLHAPVPYQCTARLSLMWLIAL